MKGWFRAIPNARLAASAARSGGGSPYECSCRGRASADSSRASSRTPASPPCSDTWRSWMARASARVIQMIMPRLFGELAEDIAILPHDFFGNVHLCRELRIVDGQADTIRRLQRIQLVALVHAQPGQQLLGQDEAGGIADGGDFQLHDALRCVITKVIRPAPAFVYRVSMAARSCSRTLRPWSSTLRAMRYSPRRLLRFAHSSPTRRFSSSCSAVNRSPPLYSTTSRRPSLSRATKSG